MTPELSVVNPKRHHDTDNSKMCTRKWAQGVYAQKPGVYAQRWGVYAQKWGVAVPRAIVIYFRKGK